MDLSVTHEEKKVVRHLTIIIVTLGLFLSWPMVHKRLNPASPLQVNNEVWLSLPDLVGTWQGSDSSTTLIFTEWGTCQEQQDDQTRDCLRSVFDSSHPLPAFPYEYEGDSIYLNIASPNKGIHTYYKLVKLDKQTLSLESISTTIVATFTKSL